MSSTKSNYWFHIKHWGIILPVAIFVPIVWNLVIIFGFFNVIEDFNVENCQKISGPSDFTHCEDFVLSDRPGIAYVNCDPFLKKHSKAIGINRLAKDEVVENGAIWEVDYSQQPAVLEKFDMGSLTNYHPLGINMDIHPVTRERTLITVNLAYKNKPSIELFTIQDDLLVHKRTIQHPDIYNPNSVHPLRDGRFRAEDGTPSFFFSNDHYFNSPILKTIESLFIPMSNVKFYNARTGKIHTVIDRLLFANGLSGTDDILFVSESTRHTVRQYKINQKTENGDLSIYLDYTSEFNVGGAPDNLNYHPAEQILAIAVLPRLVDFMKRSLADSTDIPIAPSKVVVWDTAINQTKTFLQDDGSLFSTSTGAAFDFENSMLIVSGILEEGLLVCDL